MASPSKAELWTQLSNAVKILDQFWLWTYSNSPNYDTLEDTLIQSLEGNHHADVSSALNQIRSSQNDIIGAGETLLTPIVLELGRIGYDSVAGDINTIIANIRKGMNGLSETVKNRAWSYGSISAGGSNVGNGTVYRVVTDKYGDAIENGHPVGYTVKLECIADKNNGEDTGNELFQIYGAGQVPVDLIDVGEVPGSVLEMRAVRATDGMLTNASFDDLSTTLTTDEPGWGDLSNSSIFTRDTTNIYRNTNGETTGVALKMSDNGSFTQYLGEEGIQVDVNLPVILVARYMRKNSADGTLTLRLGSQTAAVDVSTKTNDVWNDLVIGTTADEGWYDNWKEDNSGLGARIALTLASNTTGDVVLDEIVMVQPTFFDGKFYVVMAGDKDADYLIGDYFTFADTCSNTGRMQYWIGRVFGLYFPHTSGIPTYADA